MNLPPPPPPPPPPAAYPYPYGPPHIEPPRPQSLNGLSTAIVTLLCFAGLLAAIAPVAYILRSRLTGRLRSGELVTLEEVDRGDNFVIVITVFVQLLILATGIVWIIWQHRYARNAERLGGRLALGPAWAIGGWFIPVAAPILAAMQLKKAAQVTAAHATRRRTTLLILAWLIAWTVGVFATAVAAIIDAATEVETGERRDEAMNAVADNLSAGAFALIAMTAVLAIVMVRRLSSDQAKAFATTR